LSYSNPRGAAFWPGSNAEVERLTQYARLVDEWVTGIGLRVEDYGTHSLRRTKASIIYKHTGNLRAVQILLGHTKIESTVRYLGVDVEDALALAEGTDV
jgi:integrase